MEKMKHNILSYTSKPKVDFYMWTKTACISRDMYSLPPLVIPKKYFSTLKLDFCVNLADLGSLPEATPKCIFLGNVKIYPIAVSYQPIT